MDAIAAAVGLSRGHFIRRFEAVFGATPHQFRTALRLERARVLLARDLAVTDVCFALGYQSLGSFSTLFTRRTGMAPSAYRRFVQVPRPRPLIAGCFGLLALLPRLPPGAARAQIEKHRDGPSGKLSS